MVYEESLVVPHRSAKFQIFPITNSRLSASLVLNCINFLFQNFWFLIFFGNNTHCGKKFTGPILCSFGSSTATYFFFAKIPYFNYQINFQSHLTKKRDRRCLQAPIELLHGSPQLRLQKFPITSSTTCIFVSFYELLLLNFFM